MSEEVKNTEKENNTSNLVKNKHERKIPQYRVTKKPIIVLLRTPDEKLTEEELETKHRFLEEQEKHRAHNEERVKKQMERRRAHDKKEVNKEEVKSEE